MAASDAPVLVLGETGTGKELVARAIHARARGRRGRSSPRTAAVFAEGVLASELFGHEAGAFTGAEAARGGCSSKRHGGTLFLDEVGELSPRVQAALLRVLQDGTLRRVGGGARRGRRAGRGRDAPRTCREDGAAGRVSRGSWYGCGARRSRSRPCGGEGGDVELLVEAFLAEQKPKKGGKRLKVSREAMRALARYTWPGNVRELKAEVMRWVVFCDDAVNVEDLAAEIGAEAEAEAGAEAEAEAVRAERSGSAVRELRVVVEEAERAAIAAALAAEGGNLSRTARGLGIDRNTLKRKMKGFGMGRGDLTFEVGVVFFGERHKVL